MLMLHMLLYYQGWHCAPNQFNHPNCHSVPANHTCPRDKGMGHELTTNDMALNA